MGISGLNITKAVLACENSSPPKKIFTSFDKKINIIASGMENMYPKFKDFFKYSYYFSLSFL